MKYLKAKKYNHPQVKIRDFAEISQGGLPLSYVLYADLYDMSDSGSRSLWGILEGWACTEARLLQPQERQGETGTHLACPQQAGKGAKQPLLDSCLAADLEMPPTHSDAPGCIPAMMLGGRGEELESQLAAASHSGSPLPSPTAGPP